MLAPLTHSQTQILNQLKKLEAEGKLDRAYFGNIPIEVYHHPDCPGVSSTKLKSILNRNYLYAQMETFEKTKAMEFGSAFHAMVESEAEFKRLYSFTNIEAGKRYISPLDMKRLQNMIGQVKKHPEASQYLNDTSAETTFFSRCEITGVLRKVRPDRILNTTLADWKTTTDASPSHFSKMARKLQYRISARYYMDVVRDASGLQVSDFKLIACETERLYQVAVYPVHQSSLDRAATEIQKALEMIAEAERGGWKGYALNQEIII